MCTREDIRSLEPCLIKLFSANLVLSLLSDPAPRRAAETDEKRPSQPPKQLHERALRRVRHAPTFASKEASVLDVVASLQTEVQRWSKPRLRHVALVPSLHLCRSYIVSSVAS